MAMLTFIRAVAWFGVVVVFWSLNIRWGTDLDVNTGPPGQWERQVVGAGLLALLAALALSVSGRRGNPPSWMARGIALAAAGLVVLLAVLLRQKALSGITGADLISGAGWTWMLAGGGFALSAATLAMALKPAGSGKKAKAAPTTDPEPTRSASKPAKKKKRR